MLTSAETSAAYGATKAPTAYTWNSVSGMNEKYSKALDRQYHVHEIQMSCIGKLKSVHGSSNTLLPSTERGLMKEWELGMYVSKISS